MNISEVFIRRPIATSLLMAGIALFGVVAYRGLAVSDLPSVDFPTIQVAVGLPGADPTTMASAVATPLERQFTSIAGLDSMTSTSSTGNTQITLQFDLDRDIDGAAVDVQTAISEATPLLPAGLPAPPVVPQEQSRRPAHHVSGAHQRNAAAVGHRRIRRNFGGPAPVDGVRRRAGAGVGQHEVRGPGAGGSRQAECQAAGAE